MTGRMVFCYMYLMLLLQYCRGDSYEFHGCYDASSISFPIPPYTPGLTIGKCITHCTLNGNCYAGVQFTSYCYCQETLPVTILEEADCNYPCDGDPSEMCGGNMKRSMFSAACASRTTTTETTSQTSTSRISTTAAFPTTLSTTTGTSSPTLSSTTSITSTAKETTETPSTTTTKATTTATTTLLTLLPSSSKQNYDCCPCECHDNNNRSLSEIEQRLREIKKILTVPKNATNYFKWSKKCMDDDRPSSVTIGYTLGIGLLSALLAMIVFPDIVLIYKHFTCN